MLFYIPPQVLYSSLLQFLSYFKNHVSTCQKIGGNTAKLAVSYAKSTLAFLF